MLTRARAPLASSLMLVLSACGGGSASAPFAPSVEVTAANQQAVAVEVNSNAVNFTGTLNDIVPAVAVVSADAAPPFSLREVLRDLTHEAMTRATPEPDRPVAVVQSRQGGCPYGGTYAAALADSNGNGHADAGEAVSAQFNACAFTAGMPVNGGMQAVANAAGDITVTFNQLQVSESSYTTTVTSGAMTLSEPDPGITVTEHFSLSNLAVTVAAQAGTRHFILNEDLTLVVPVAGGSGVTSVSGSGNILSDNANLAGGVSFDIGSPILKNTARSSVQGGAMTISGSAATVLYLSFAVPDNQSVTLLLKKDGQSIAVPKVVSWSALSSF